jgi:hypothetical protein
MSPVVGQSVLPTESDLLDTGQAVRNRLSRHSPDDIQIRHRLAEPFVGAPRPRRSRGRRTLRHARLPRISVGAGRGGEGCAAVVRVVRQPQN